MIAASLPDLEQLDLEAAKALLIAQHETYTAALSSRAGEIERLELLVEKLQRLLFGTKSEKVVRQIEQLELELEDLEASSAAEERAASTRASRPVAAKPFRRPLPEHLPREVHTHLPGHNACPDCGGKLRALGEDAAEMLEYVRASFKVIRHVRPKLSCADCERIVQAPAPSRPIDRGLAGPGLLAHVLVSKYADHQPLYRQSEIYAREGVDLDRSTLAGWVGASSDLLAPLVDAIRKHVLFAGKLHADDTPVPVLAPGTGKTKTGRLWTYVRDDRPSGDATAAAVWFAYSPDRKGEHPKRHLQNFTGTLQADAYAGLPTLLSDKSLQSFTRISKKEHALLSQAASLFKDEYYDHALLDVWNAAVSNLRRRVEVYSTELFISVVKEESGRKKYDKDGESLSERWAGVDDLVLITGCSQLGVLNKEAGKALEMINWMRNHASPAHDSDQKSSGRM